MFKNSTRKPDHYGLDIQHFCYYKKVQGIGNATITIENETSEITDNGSKRVKIRAQDTNSFNVNISEISCKNAELGYLDVLIQPIVEMESIACDKL